jgi:hypothetical protein
MKNCVVQFYMEPEGFSQPDFVNIKVNEELLEYSKNLVSYMQIDAEPIMY